ncbi:hypothetical protein JCM5350_000840 [Sporobolomyces pararoseus]
MIRLYKSRILQFLKAHGFRWIHRRPTEYTLFSIEGEPNNSPSAAIALGSIESPSTEPLEEDSKVPDDSDFDSDVVDEDDDEFDPYNREEDAHEEIKDVDNTEQTRRISSFVPENAQALFNRLLIEYCYHSS